MARRQFKPEQIINKLREAEVLMSQDPFLSGSSLPVVEPIPYSPVLFGSPTASVG